MNMLASRSTRFTSLLAVVGLFWLAAGFFVTASRTADQAKVLDSREEDVVLTKVQPQGNGSCPTDVEGDRWVVICNEETQFSAVCIIDKQSGRPFVYLSTNPVGGSDSVPVHIELGSLEEWSYTQTSTAAVYKPNYPSSISLSEAINATLPPGQQDPHYFADWSLHKEQTEKTGQCVFTGQVKHRGSAADDPAETNARLVAEFKVDRQANATPAVLMVFTLKDYSFAGSGNFSKLALIYRVFGTNGALDWTNDKHVAVSDDHRVLLSGWNASSSNDTTIPVQMLTWVHHPHLVNLLTDEWASDSIVDQLQFSTLFTLTSSASCLAASLFFFVALANAVLLLSC